MGLSDKNEQKTIDKNKYFNYLQCSSREVQGIGHRSWVTVSVHIKKRLTNLNDQLLESNKPVRAENEKERGREE